MFTRCACYRESVSFCPETMNNANNWKVSVQESQKQGVSL